MEKVTKQNVGEGPEKGTPFAEQRCGFCNKRGCAAMAGDSNCAPAFLPKDSDSDEVKAIMKEDWDVDPMPSEQ